MKSIKQFALALVLAVMGLGGVQAATPAGTQVNAMGTVEGGSNTTFTWVVPSAAMYKVWVHVPSGATATNALYRVRPQGNFVGNNLCSSTDPDYPCFQIAINQSVNQNNWVQLTLTNKSSTQWKFSNAGYVGVNASNLNPSEMLKVAEISFQDNGLKIGSSYQGGIIFYLDSSRQHGLIAAPTGAS